MSERIIVAVPALLDGRGTDVVLIEHEYGIFGGEAGSYVLSLVQELRQPFVVTLHTVLSNPTQRQAEVLGELCHRAALVTVFTETARRMVVEAGVAPAGRVRVVPHGAPTLLLPRIAGWPRHRDRRRRGGAPAGRARGTMAHLEGRTVLSTFGLISAGKGIETAIEALAEIVPLHPDVLYLVAGQTHPEVVKEEGERYRLSLERLVRDRGLERNVQFLDRFLSIEELAFLLSSTDLYLTPYRSREQIVSGALTFADRRRLPRGVHAVLLRRGSARLRRRRAGAVRRSDGVRQGHPAVARQSRRSRGRGPRGPAGRRRPGVARRSARRPSTCSGTRIGLGLPARNGRASAGSRRRRPSGPTTC